MWWGYTGVILFHFDWLLFQLGIKIRVIPTFIPLSFLIPFHPPLPISSHFFPPPHPRDVSCVPFNCVMHQYALVLDSTLPISLSHLVSFRIHSLLWFFLDPISMGLGRQCDCVSIWLRGFLRGEVLWGRMGCCGFFKIPMRKWKFNYPPILITFLPHCVGIGLILPFHVGSIVLCIGLRWCWYGLDRFCPPFGFILELLGYSLYHLGVIVVLFELLYGWWLNWLGYMRWGEL